MYSSVGKVAFVGANLKYVSSSKVELWLVDEEKKTLGHRFAEGEPLNSKGAFGL